MGAAKGDVASVCMRRLDGSGLLACHSTIALSSTKLDLNDGILAAEGCLEILRAHASRSAFRFYPEADNAELKAASARRDGVTTDHVFLGNGSGPILKQGIPWLTERAIKSSLRPTQASSS